MIAYKYTPVKLFKSPFLCYIVVTSVGCEKATLVPKDEAGMLKNGGVAIVENCKY